MKYKVIGFSINSNGKIELTKEELEDLLQQAFDTGFIDGKNTVEKETIVVPSPIYPIYPYYQTTATDKIEITCEKK